LFQVFPVEDGDVAIDPVLSVEFVDFLQAAADRLLSSTFLQVGAQHFLQFLALKSAPHPFLFMGIQQYALSIENIVFELSNIQISIGKVPFAVVLKPISEIEAAFVALRL
jgi:hypothetical protein